MTCAGECDDLYVSSVAGFESDRCASRDIESETPSRGTVKLKRCIYFEEVEVTSDLNGSVADVRNSQVPLFKALIGDNFSATFSETVFAGNHRMGW